MRLSNRKQLLSEADAELKRMKRLNEAIDQKTLGFLTTKVMEDKTIQKMKNDTMEKLKRGTKINLSIKIPVEILLRAGTASYRVGSPGDHRANVSYQTIESLIEKDPSFNGKMKEFDGQIQEFKKTFKQIVKEIAKKHNIQIESYTWQNVWDEVFD